MPRYAQNPETGQKFLYDDSRGEWREMSGAEEKIEKMGYAGQAVAAVEGATGIGSIAGIFDEGIAERVAALQAINPGTSKAALVGSLGLGAAGAAKGALTASGMAGGRMAQRIQARTAGKGADESMGFRRMPDEMLPASAQGAGQFVRAGATATIPGRLATDFLIRVPNQRNLNRLVGRALRLTDDELRAAGGKIDNQLYGVVQERSHEAFRQVGQRITKAVDEDEVINMAVKLNQEGYITNQKLAAMIDDTAGENLMAMRSEMRAAQRQAGDVQVSTMLQNTVDEIDGIIEKGLDEAGDKVAKQLYGDARARYKLELAIEKGNVLGRDDNVSATLMDTQLRKLFGDSYRAGKRNENVPQDLADALQGVRKAQGMNLGLPTSGTTERALAANLLSGLTGGVVGGSLL